MCTHKTVRQHKLEHAYLYIVLDDSDNFAAIVKKSGKMGRDANTFEQLKERIVEVTKKGLIF